ncbi:MAG: HisS family protein, partial [Thermoplasmataceae archaeon]
MKFESLRGFRDIYPEDAEPRENMFNTAKRVAHSFGFQIIDFPSLEPLDLYRIKSGDELVSQTFSFVDKGGREVTMVPEATPSVVRMLTSKKDLQKPVRWFSLPKIWRYEEPQSGRLREHVQFNADLFGPDTPDADAELIGMAATILDSLGLSGNYEIRMNHRGMMEKILKAIQVQDTSSAFSVIDRFRKLGRDEFIEALDTVGISGKSAEMITKLAATRVESVYLKQAVSEIVPLTESLSADLDRIVKTMEMVSLFTDSMVVIDFSIVRGLSYYTGIV